MGNQEKIREILKKMPRWPRNRIPRGDTLREIERKLSWYGEGYTDKELDILSAEVDAEIKRMFDHQNAARAKREQAKAAQVQKEKDNARRFGNY